MQPGTEGVGDVISGLLPLLSGFGNKPQQTFQSTVQAQQSAKKQRTEEEQRQYEARLKQAGDEIFALPRESMSGQTLKQIADKYDVRSPDVMQMTTNVLKLESDNQAQLGRIKAERFDTQNDLKAILSGKLPGNLQGIGDEITKMDDEISRIQGLLGDGASQSKQYQALTAKRKSADDAYKREKDRVWMKINDPTARQTVEGILTDPDGTRRKVKVSAEEAKLYGSRFKEGVPEFFGKTKVDMGDSQGWTGLNANQQLDQVGKFYKDQAPYMFDDMGFIKPEYADKYPKVANLLAEERRRVANGERPKLLTLTEYLDPKTAMPQETVSPQSSRMYARKQ